MPQKRRRVAPGFKLQPPFDPIAGMHAHLGQEGVMPYCALMQVAAEDIHVDYVLCRGFDTRIVRFVDYEEGNADKPGIPVAKPYGNRRVGAYEIGGIYPALLPIQGTSEHTPPSPAGVPWRLGQNPGVVETNPAEGGQPRDLTETVTLLYDNTGRAVNWLLIDSSRACDDLPPPGSYAATVGATIGPGATGPILITTCDLPITEDAINHSQCTFRLGDRVIATIDQCCTVLFTGCGTVEPVDCCDNYAAVCIGGVSRIIKFNESASWASWVNDWGLPDATCRGAHCPGYFTSAEISIECVSDTVTANYYFEWGCATGCGPPYSASGSFDISGLCEDPPVGHSEVVPLYTSSTEGECELTIYVTPELEPCPCDPDDPDPEPTDCCDKLLWFCLHGGSVHLPVNGGNYMWDVSDCCDGCTSATLEINLSCDDIGGISLQHKFICDGGTPEIAVESLTVFCTSDISQVVNIEGSCFLQIFVSLSEIPCDPCEETIDNSCCTGIPTTLTMTIVGGVYAGTWNMTYDSGLEEWLVDSPPAMFTGRLSCSMGGWNLTFEMDNYGTLTESCSPFDLEFDVTGNSYGITSLTIIA